MEKQPQKEHIILQTGPVFWAQAILPGEEFKQE
jgi:hypothetical protein